MNVRRNLNCVILYITCAIVLTGCGTSVLSSRGTNPVIQDFAYNFWSDGSSLSTTASRRLALMVYKREADGTKNLITCAEPPPDVGETFAKALATQLEVSAPKTAGDAKAAFGFSDQAATAIAPLMARTQGLQILRDSAYTLCVDYMNGWIPNAETYLRIKQDRFDKALLLIEKELPLLAARAAAVKPPSIPDPASLPSPISKPSSSAPDGTSLPVK